LKSSYHPFITTEPWFHPSGVIKHELGQSAKIAVIGCLRLASKYTLPYVRQLLNLQQNCQTIEAIVIVHDKPTEETRPVVEELAKCGLPIRLLEEAQADAGVETMSAKAQQWAGIANQAIGECLRVDCTHVLWLESDLTFPLDLLDRLVGRACDIVSPVVFLGGEFYDTWGFRDLDGNNINSVREATKGRTPFLSLVEVGSAGSCVLFRAEIFRQGVRFRGEHENGLLVGVCQDARQLGYRVWLDTGTSVIHPTNSWREQVWVVDRIRAVTPSGSEFLNLRNQHMPIATILPDYLERWIEALGVAATPPHDMQVEKSLSERRIGITVFAEAKPGIPLARRILARVRSLIARLRRLVRDL
jgi:hypothetical protein